MKYNGLFESYPVIERPTESFVKLNAFFFANLCLKLHKIAYFIYWGAHKRMISSIMFAVIRKAINFFYDTVRSFATVLCLLLQLVIVLSTAFFGCLHLSVSTK